MSEPVSFGYETVDADEKTRRVGTVFSNVAAKYDVMNDAMSGGMHRLWKDQFVRRVKPQPGEAVLDMAGGTGDIAFRLAARGAEVTVADINQRCRRGFQSGRWNADRRLRGRARTPRRWPILTAFDAHDAFGMGNVTHIDQAPPRRSACSNSADGSSA
jgi:demethylmenaquinone methyltransferase/2-methoxy-6-polyprenyl-1,4-benzoquinol methylase